MSVDELVEALSDERIGDLPVDTVGCELDALLGSGWAESDGRTVRLRPGLVNEAREHVERRARGHPASRTATATTYGRVLDDFVRYCRDELDDVTLVEAAPACAVLQWQGERARVELRLGHVACERLTDTVPTLLITDCDADLVDRFLSDQELHDRVAAYDVNLPAKLNVVRCPVFVHFEWFLREAYRLKVVAMPEFTAGLLAKGVISTGMG